MMTFDAVDGYLKRRALLGRRVVDVVSYPLEDGFVCTIEAAGAPLARGAGQTRPEAETAALHIAQARLSNRERMVETLADLRTRIAALDRRLSEPPPPATKP